MTDVARMPLRRTEGLKVVDLEGETLVYDLASHRSHCLNETAALVWRHCDGLSPVADVAGRLRPDLHGPLGEEVVRFALGQLAEIELLEGPVAMAARGQEISRRVMLGKMARVGATAAALPVIASLVAPGVAEAQSPSPTATPAPTSTAVPTATATSIPAPTATATTTPPSGPNLAASPSSVQGGQYVTVTWGWTGTPTPTPTDWIGLYTQGETDNHNVVGGSGGGMLHNTGGAASGTWSMIMPVAPGIYVFRFLPNGGYVHTAQSNPVTVTEAF